MSEDRRVLLACRECSSTNIYRRMHSRPPYRCGECGATFEVPVRRRPKPAGRPSAEDRRGRSNE